MPMLLRRMATGAALGGATLFLSVTPAGAASTSPSGAPQNIVQAESTSERMVAQRSHVQVAGFSGDTNDSTNAAIAYAHDCTGCRSVAVAFQAVLVWGQQSTSAPENDAIVVNDTCNSCFGFAYAYQDVIQTSGPARLSEDAAAEVHAIARQAGRIAHSGMAAADLAAALDTLKSRFKQTVERGIVGAASEQETSHRSVDEA